MDDKETPMIDHWRSFVDAISKPGAIVKVDTPTTNPGIWGGHSFGSATQFIAERIAALEAEAKTNPPIGVLQ